MSRSVKLTLGLIAVAALVFAGFVIFLDPKEDQTAPSEATGTATGQLVREDSPRLSEDRKSVV